MLKSFFQLSKCRSPFLNIKSKYVREFFFKCKKLSKCWSPFLASWLSCLNHVGIQTAISWSSVMQVSYPLGHIVFWSIVKASVISVNVLSIVNCKVLVVELYQNRSEKNNLGLICWSKWFSSNKWKVSNSFLSLLMMIVGTGTRDCLHNGWR